MAADKDYSRPDWVSKLFDILDERGEAPRRVVEEEMMLLIPSGPAHREGVAKAKADHAYRLRKLGLEPDPDYEARGDLTRKGRQRLALKSIHTEVAAGRVEKFERNDRVWLRRRSNGASPDAHG
jgi:hypothetical protein